jgi:hypothetical protein
MHWEIYVECKVSGGVVRDDERKRHEGWSSRCMKRESWVENMLIVITSFEHEKRGWMQG